MTHHRSRIAWIPALALLFTLTACSATGGGIEAAPSTADMAVEQMSGDGAIGGESMPEMAQDSAAMESNESKFIQEAWLTLGVDDVQKAMAEISTLVDDLDGRVDQRSMYRGTPSEITSASMQIRVPGDSLTDAMDELGEVGVIRNESTSAYDVTMQHIDLTARVDSLSASITRLEALLDETSSVTELIEVETALADRQAELESLTAQLESLTDAVQYATIGVELQLNTSPVPSNETSFWDAIVAGFWSIVATLNGLFILLGYALPWLVVVGIIALIVVAIVKARRKRKTTR